MGALGLGPLNRSRTVTRYEHDMHQRCLQAKTDTEQHGELCDAAAKVLSLRTNTAVSFSSEVAFWQPLPSHDPGFCRPPS